MEECIDAWIGGRNGSEEYMNKKYASRTHFSVIFDPEFVKFVWSEYL